MYNHRTCHYRTEIFRNIPSNSASLGGICDTRDESNDLVNINPVSGDVIAKAVKTDVLEYGSLSQKNGVGSVLNVPSANYPTIQSAIDAAGPGTIIQLAPGDYYENLRMNGRGEKLLQIRDRDLNDLLLEYQNRGILLQGDTRWTLPHYVNGRLNPTNSFSDARVTITTSVPGVGPFSGQAASSFGTRVPVGPLQIQNTTGTAGNLAGPGQADVTNNFAGRIALTREVLLDLQQRHSMFSFPPLPALLVQGR